MVKRFINKKILPDKLKDFGFKYSQKTGFLYKTNILENQFELTICINKDGNITTRLIDILSDEPYTLHLVEDATGSFIGSIKEEYNNIMDLILDTCFEKRIFKEDTTIKLLDYVKKEYGTVPEYLWEKFPQNAVLRRVDNSKWYGAILTVKGDKIGLKTHDSVEVINLKTDKTEEIIDNVKYFPAYHMNKKYWISVLLNNSTDWVKLEQLIEQSYSSVRSK